MLTVTNMTTMRNSEVVPNKFKTEFATVSYTHKWTTNKCDYYSVFAVNVIICREVGVVNSF